MKCQICGGMLRYSEGLYICENCGAKQQIEIFFEKTEVFICYIESDSQGRRTKDSVMAQELYNKLETAKINTFNQRISAAELTGTDFEKACTKAVNKAKVIIIAGASKENFESLFEQYKEYFAEKKILPVYSEIDAYDLPKQFSNLQALNYDNIGAVNDLAKAVLQELGRENEIDVISVAEIKRQKRKRRIILSAGIVAILVILIGTYVVFGTPYVLESKKYSYAKKLVENENYIEAISLYTKLGDYENSSNALEKIYAKYDGYYNSCDGKYSIYFNIKNNTYSEIEIIYYTSNNKQIRLTSEAVFKDSELNYNFVDNQNNQGKCNIKLLDDGINFILITERKSSDLYIEDCEYKFNFSEKADAPLIQNISRNTLIDWLTNGIEKNQIITQGYELEYLKQLGNGNAGNLYQISNTNIQIELGIDYALSISAPAEILLPDKIGTQTGIILENDILYVPFGQPGLGASKSIETGNTIQSNTTIVATSKRMIESTISGGWEDYLELKLSNTESD